MSALLDLVGVLKKLSIKNYNFSIKLESHYVYLQTLLPFINATTNEETPL